MKQTIATIGTVLAIFAIIRMCNASHSPLKVEIPITDTIEVDEPYVEKRVARKINKSVALKAIKEFEGFRSEMYKCTNGVPTIGWGTTKPCYDELVRLKYVDSTFYSWGDTLSKEKADIILSKTVDMIYVIAKSRVPDLKYLSPKAQAAFISWAYQCGVGSEQSKKGILGVFPEIANHFDDKMLYDILTERAFYSKYKARRLKEASIVIM